MPEDSLPPRKLAQWLLERAGVRLFGDVYERSSSLGPAFPVPLDRKRRDRLRAIEDGGALFIHIPKNAGMAVSQALYGRQVYHPTIRYYRRFAPDLVDRLPSFAIWRDPAQRFLSALRFARTVGNPGNRIAAGFRETYARFATVDDALDHVEAGPDIFALDHIFRPQFWYVADRSARIAVDRILLIDELDSALADMRLPNLSHVAHLNESADLDIELTVQQENRLRRLYAIDFAIHDSLRSRAMPAILNSPMARQRALD
ncbi:Sulfotransferase family 2 domain-containing protein [Sphingomonas antarctica]|uniref:sulfotransferase n=1 Tax=Sphingomonas antarctica TaxID=2040274 RepID=UPI0039EB5490